MEITKRSRFVNDWTVERLHLIYSLHTISDLAHKALPSSEYLRHDSKLYSSDKVKLYELCKSIIKICDEKIERITNEQTN